MEREFSKLTKFSFSSNVPVLELALSKPTDNGNVVIVWALAAKSGHKQFYEHSPGIAYYCLPDLKAGKWNLGGNKEGISSC